MVCRVFQIAKHLFYDRFIGHQFAIAFYDFFAHFLNICGTVYSTQKMFTVRYPKFNGMGEYVIFQITFLYGFNMRRCDTIQINHGKWVLFIDCNGDDILLWNE